MDVIKLKETVEKAVVTAKVVGPKYFPDEEISALEEVVKLLNNITDLRAHIVYEKITCTANNWKAKLEVIEKSEKIFDEFLNK